MSAKQRLKLLVRGDDLGFTEAVNYGLAKSIRCGIVRNVGLMPNMPMAEHGYSLVRDFGGICVGQHTNIVAGRPLSDPARIPSLVDEAGAFLSSMRHRSAEQDLVVFEEAVIEIEAQLARFVEICGREPGYFEGHAVNSPNFNRALGHVASQHGLLHIDFPPALSHNGVPMKLAFPRELAPGGLYDPLRFILEDQGGVLNSGLALMIFHPGFVDQDILRMSSFNMIRPLELEALCSAEVWRWVQSNDIELVNFSMFYEPLKIQQ